MYIGLYKSTIVPVLYSLLILFIIIFFLNINLVIKQFRRIKKRTWMYLGIIFLAGFVLRFFIFPHAHLMYIDEPWYIETAKNINQRMEPVWCQYVGPGEENCSLTPKAPGWPFLISILFLLGGTYHSVFYLSSMIGSLSIILMFLLTFLIFRQEKTALWSALLLAFVPIHIIWSNSVETNNASLFFVLLTMTFFFIYIHRRDTRIIPLVILGYIFAFLVRPENALLAFIIMLGYTILLRKKLLEYYPLIVLGLIGLIIIIEAYFLRIFRFAYLTIDLYYLNLLDFIKVVSFNYIFLIIFLIGYHKRLELKYVISVFLIFFMIYLPLYSETRMALTPLAFLIILAASSLERIRKYFGSYSLKVPAGCLVAAIMLIIFSFFFFSFHGRFIERNEQNILETISVPKAASVVPDDCYIIMEWPTIMNAVSDHKVIPTSHALLFPASIDGVRCLYYFHDGACSEPSISDSVKYSFRCEKMLEDYDMREIKKFSYRNTSFYLYKIK